MADTVERPKLSERGEEEFKAVLDSAKQKLKSAFDELSDIYVESAMYIESDVWHNYRNDLREALRYEIVEGRELESQWAQGVRQQIFEEHKEKLLPLLNQDNLREIERLNERIDSLEEMRSHF